MTSKLIATVLMLAGAFCLFETMRWLFGVSIVMAYIAENGFIPFALALMLSVSMSAILVYFGISLWKEQLANPDASSD